MTVSPFARGPDLRIVAAVLMVAVVTLVLRVNLGRAGQPFFADTDDVMRMVVVRDFLAGQAWYDLTAHRLNTPWGAEIHWSRLVDLPIAALVFLATPLLGPDGALLFAGYVWPMVLLGLLLWLSAELAFRLVGPDGVLPAVVLPVLSPAITAEFTPGRVDHHNVIILLTMAMLWAAVEGLKRPLHAALCGLFAATALAIATESLPPIAAAILVTGLAWAIDNKHAAGMRAFGLSFALGAVVHLAIFRPPARWLEPACDVLSPLYVAVALLVGVVFTAASFVSLRARWQRLLVLGVPAVIGLGLILLAFPQCLGGPYGELDPWLQANWIANIVEARPWIVTLSELPPYAVGVGIPILLATGALLYRLWKIEQNRGEWAVVFVFLAATALVMLIQVRGARLAVMPAMPVAAWLIVAARRRYLARPGIGQIAGLLLSWLGFAGVVLALSVATIAMAMPREAQTVAEARAQKENCLVPAAFADLAQLPPERIISPIDLGAHILLHTPHEVVSAPYHRNQQGVRDTFRFFNDPLDTVRAMLVDRGIGLVVICPEMPEVQGLPDHAADSFASLYENNELPDWLEDVSLPGSPLQVFAVLPVGN